MIDDRLAPPVDVVVVAFNSRDRLKGCVEPLAGRDDIRVIVVDNASTDGTLEAVEGLDVSVIPLDRNGGFAHGCNVGWRSGSASFVLFLNPDANIDPDSVRRLSEVLARERTVGAAAPMIIEADGSLAHSQRRFPNPVITFSQALFLHRLWPRSSWTNDIVCGERPYETARSPDWVSGACLLVRRSVLERLDGLDERFFMYCEDVDLCRRLRDLGYDIRYEPSAHVVHEGGGSAPRASLLPVLAESRVLYAEKHFSRATAALERAGVALGALTHVVVSQGGRATRTGHARALIAALMVRAGGAQEETPGV
jgi:GT2 family glycosyltransferase